MQFHERLYEVRKRSGMTQSDLAEKLDVSRQAVSRWELGTAKPDFENLVAISDLFGVPIDYLLKGNEASADPPFGANVEPKTPKKVGKSVFWETLWCIALIAYSILALVFGLASMDLMNGLIVAAIVLAGVALLIGCICLTVWIVRKIVT